MRILESVRTTSTYFVHINLFFMTKRLLDIFLSFVLLLLLSPIMLCIGYAIYKKEGNPVFCKEIRAGKNNRPFSMYTFRTTTIPSRVIRALPPHPFPSAWDGGVPDKFNFRLDNKTMHTAIGLKLKKYGLHKLPQLINVLKGDMSFVGPSPELIEIANYYNRHQLNRLKVKPGITGYAQINGNSINNHAEKINHDLHYTQNHSYLLEAKIIYGTLKKQMKRKSMEDRIAN